jgi:hypothetical protein
MWTCPKCQTKVDPTFDVCWNCGTTVDGVEDPTFVKADDEGPIAGDPLTPELDVNEDVAVETDLPEPIRGDLVVAYSALDLMEATFLADQLNAEGIQAVADKYDLHDALGSMEASPSVWVRADDLPQARAWLESYDRNKATTLGE